jgi:hypothetical protein
MSNGDPERLPEDDMLGETEAPTSVRKARAVKTTRKRIAKTSVPRTSAGSAVPKSTAAKSKVANKTTATGSKRTTSGYTRVPLGDSEMFVSREIAGALTKKDLKRLQALFKRMRKRARKRGAKQKA